MEEIARKHHISVNESDEVGEEKWANCYSSNHQILLVGEGDFSFSMSLAISFGSASNIVASSLDTYDVLIKKYKRAKTNLEILHSFGAQVLHGVDTINMKLHTHLRMRKFDRIVYNFPHAGFLGKETDHLVIMMHKNLVRGFFRNACSLLRPNGEVHLTHKTTHPFDFWDIEKLATQNCLTLIECVKFKIDDYPGYNNKRGAGRNPDQPFPLGECSTFKFILSSKAIKLKTSHHRNPQQQKRSECFWIFKEYFNHARSTFGQVDGNLLYSVQEMLEIGFERYNAENRGNPLSGYVNLLEELRNLSRKRVAFLQNWLMEIDHDLYCL